MKVLVTGADGLLGGNLVRELLGRGIEVKVLIQPGNKSPTLDGLDIEKVDCDLLKDDGVIAGAMGGCDATFHCAAITDQWADPKLVWSVNLDGTRKVLDACVESGMKKLVFVGSASTLQFGLIDAPADETAPFPKVYTGVPYVESKQAASELVRKFVRERGLDAVIVCPTFILGPYDARPSSGELIRQFIVRNLKFTSPGGKNFVYAPDAAVAMANALEKGKAGESYIMGGGNLTYKDFFTKVANLAGREPPKIVVPGPIIKAGGAVGSLIEKITGKKATINYTIARLSLCGTYYTPAKAVGELDMPQTPTDKAIEDAYNSLKQYGHLPEN